MTDSNHDVHRSFLPFKNKMEEAGVDDLCIRAFNRNYSLLHSGETGKLSRDTISPVSEVPALDDIPADASAQDILLGKVAIIKLNGGLGTSMGLNKSKSIIPVRNGLHFVDIISRQVRHTNAAAGVHIPVIFMNSFNTHEDTLAALGPYADLKSDIPFDFLQNKVPKVRASDLTPAASVDDSALEWCPPGHGDIYIALRSSGVLKALLEHGYEYAFISNADNLGAVLEPRIMEYMAENRVSFLMEVAARTAADRKGGHLAMLANGQLTLRESAQCPDNEREEFQDISLYRFFNTNNLWVHLPSLRSLLDRYDNVLPLPMIRNEKPLNPRDPSTEKVYQLETAMGSAISLFDASAAMLVPRTRFAPVKTTDDLLAIRSDAYTLTEGYQITPNPERTGGPPTVTLDKEYYKHIQQLDAAFPHGSPSLVQCSSLQIDGPFVFGKNVVIVGDVQLSNPEDIPHLIDDGIILQKL